MKAKAQKWGNSLAVRVPKAIAEQAGVAANDALEIEVLEDGVIVLKPLRRRRDYRLSDLLKGITKDNLHAEIDFSRAGREAL